MLLKKGFAYKLLWFLLTLWGCVSFKALLANSQSSPNPYYSKVHLGPRPNYLIEDMEDSPLKEKLRSCRNLDMKKSDLSIGHRGAPLQFPEHTKESYEAAAVMGAGVIECDVTFTSDQQLVCRHSQCDLHFTTNILSIPSLASKCTQNFVPADPKTGRSASAKCCTSDITLEEFKQLCGKMEGFNPQATSVSEYLRGTHGWRTDLYSRCGTVMSHKDSIELFKKLDVKMVPELKSPEVKMPYKGDFTQDKYAQKMVDEYKEQGVSSEKVFLQSFNFKDILYWLKKEPQFAQQAVYLDGRFRRPGFSYDDPESYGMSMKDLVEKGLKIIAPPLWMLVKLDAQGKVVPSEYAKSAKEAGLDIITWTFERSGLLKADPSMWYYHNTYEAMKTDGDKYELLDVMVQKVGIRAIFSDWPATVTYYANCFGL